MSARSYRVAWPYANIRVIDPSTGSMTVVGLAKDTPVPQTADPADVERLAAKGAVVAVEQPRAEPAAKPVPEPVAEPVKEKADESKRIAAKPKGNGS